MIGDSSTGSRWYSVSGHALVVTLKHWCLPQACSVQMPVKEAVYPAPRQLSCLLRGSGLIQLCMPQPYVNVAQATHPDLANHESDNLLVYCMSQVTSDTSHTI